MPTDYWYDEFGNAHRIVNEKLVLLRGTEPEMKSFEDLHEALQGLLRSKAARWAGAYEFDDLVQTAAIALWQAFEKYDYTERPIPFAAVAATFIKYSLLNYHTKHKSKVGNKTSRIRSISSLHDLIDDGNGESTELQELIGEEDICLENTADRLLLEQLLRRVPASQQRDLLLYVDGHTMRELAATQDRRSQQQLKRMRIAFIKLRSLYLRSVGEVSRTGGVR